MSAIARSLVLVATLVALGSPATASAWGATGHRVTGAIAQPLLSEDARAAVVALLGPETLAEAATWADEMRSNPAAFWQQTAGPWHYVTVPDGERYADVGAPPEGDAVTALTRFAQVLRDEAADAEEKRLALRFAIHIIGDLHQPLHVGNGTDRGGNDVRVRWFREPTNLHRVWDSQMIDGQRLSFTEWSQWLSARLTPERIAALDDPDPLVWIAESRQLRMAVYEGGEQLGWDYQYAHLPSVRRRLTEAGVRIAAWLNVVLRPPT